MVALSAGIMFLLFTFWREEFYEGGPRVRRAPMSGPLLPEVYEQIILH
jgi:hypothetical protein